VKRLHPDTVIPIPSDSTSPVLLELREVAMGYPGAGPASPPVVRPLSLTLGRGEVVCLLGPNGSGKSTLLRTVAGAQLPLAGAVRVGGEEVPRLSRRELARRIALVLTDPIYSWSLTGYEVAGLGRLPWVGWTGGLGAHDHAVVRSALETARALPLAARPIQELSDGERQRVLLARALAQEASLLLLDEITAFLDLPHRLEVMRLLGELAREGGRSVILSTHDLELALRTADRIWLLPGDGSLVDGGPEDLVLSGDIGRAFAQHGVRFDMDAGHFDWEVPVRGRALVAGEGREAHWTRRALRRSGFQVMDEGAEADVRIEVEGGEGAPSWTVEGKDGVRRFTTIREVLRVVSARREGAAYPSP